MKASLGKQGHVNKVQDLVIENPFFRFIYSSGENCTQTYP